ncbi:MAG TPA: PAS domain-containing protein [Gaiellaceae bacterium]|nr:PAS domain-containing protein [Gaiellaceae bacterium]
MTGGPIRRPELDELETFVLAARHGSLTRAADELRLSKTAVAKRLRSLEAIVGRRLLDRGPRGATLTQEGRLLLPQVEELLAESDRLLGQLSAGRTGGDALRISGLRSLSGSSRLSTEQVLQQTEHVFAEIFHATSDAIVVLSAEDGTVLEANDAFTRLTGYLREQAIGRTTAELGLVPAAVLAADLADAGSPGGVVDHVTELRTQSGAIRHVEFSLQPIVLAGARRLLGVGRDISERVERERAIVKRGAQEEAVAALGLAGLRGEPTGAILARSAKLCASHVDAPLAGVWELVGDLLELRSVYGLPRARVRDVGQTPGARGRLLELFANGPDIAARDVTRDGRFGKHGLRSLGMRSVIAVLIGAPDQEPYGGLVVASPEVGAFDDADRDFVHAVANILGLLVRAERRADADARRRIQLGNFAALLDESRDPTVLIAPDGRYVYLNASARRFRNVPADADPTGVSIYETLDARSARRLREQVLPETESNGRWEGRFTVGRPGGARTAGRLTTFLVRDPITAAPRWIAAVFRPD